MFFAIKLILLKFIFLFGSSIFGLYVWWCFNSEYIANIVFDQSLIKKQFDFIVVGGGSAGSLLALRLAENSNASVLLLEAGCLGSSGLDIPAVLPLLQLSSVDWQYTTVPQEHACRAFHNNMSHWPRGKILGGSGRLNNMLYSRGHPYDFRDWYHSANTYKYEDDILQYFNKIETFDNTTHTGPTVPIQSVPFLTELSDAVITAVESLGIPIRSVNGPHYTGFMKPLTTMRNSIRYSTGHYLLENKPKNLVISTHSLVEELLFNEDNKSVVYGVKFTRFAEEYSVNATKAVILSGGTINSAQLLMLSGIGPRKHLNEKGIKTRLDLPVGDNLQDHIASGADLVRFERPLSLTPNTMLSPMSFLDYLLHGKGPWTSIQTEIIGVIYSDCFLNRKNLTYDECEAGQTKSPDLEIMAVPLGFNSDIGAHLRNIVGVTDNIWDNYISKYLLQPVGSIVPILLHPKSRGTVRLRDRDPKSHPLINPRYLSEQEDVDLLLKGIEIVKIVMESGPLKALGAKLNRLHLPGCELFEFDSRDYWECYIRHVTLTVYHPVGTCKMGNDSTSVVDYGFKVIGMSNLYVVDASVMPTLTSANPNAATVMLAQKASDILRKEYNFDRYYRGNVVDQEIHSEL